MTMHNWESFQKLIQNWEEQSIQDQFKYTRFDYKSDEWDNVPPVIPRFMFYMQNCIEKEVEWSQELNERQTTKDLRKEMYDQLAQQSQSLNDETAKREANVQELNQVDDNL